MRMNIQDRIITLAEDLIGIDRWEIAERINRTGWIRSRRRG